MRPSTTSVVVCGLVLAAGASLAAGPVFAQPKGGQLPDWSGVWAATEARNIDPTTKSGQFQANAPLNAAYLQKYKDSLASRVAGTPVGDIGCLPEGPPRIMRAGYPFEVVVTPKETWMSFEIKTEVRRIYTDGRKPDDPDPSFEGYSTGHWEGDTLVFDTVALKAGTFDSGGLIHSDQLTLHERLRKVAPDMLEDIITMTDPKVFTKPWTVTRHYKLHKEFEIKEYVCEENNRNPIDASGRTGVALTAAGK
jgi:hypothetical protein